MVFLAALAACSSQAPPAAPPPAPAPDPGLDAGVPSPLADPTSALLLGIAAGTRAAKDLLDDKRGFVLVEYDGIAPDHPRAGPNGVLKSARRVCADEALDVLRTLTSDLETRTSRGTNDVFQCSGSVCAHPPRDTDDVAGSYAFQAPDGRYVLGVVVRMAHTPSAPREQQALEAWVDGELHDLTGEPCPEG